MTVKVKDKVVVVTFEIEEQEEQLESRAVDILVQSALGAANAPNTGREAITKVVKCIVRDGLMVTAIVMECEVDGRVDV